MSQRNPMNDRYTSDERQGKTRKSAAAAKPKSKAAASVRVQTPQKTKQQNKANRKIERQKQAEIDRKYYNPPTPEYKRLRKLWWVCLVGAIACTAFSWFARSLQPEFLSFIGLGGAYVLIIVAFYIDFSKIRKVRRKYQEEMMSKKSKELRAAEKQQRAAERERAAQAAAEGEVPPKKTGLFGTGIGPNFSFSNLGAKKKQEGVTSDELQGGLSEQAASEQALPQENAKKNNQKA